MMRQDGDHVSFGTFLCCYVTDQFAAAAIDSRENIGTTFHDDARKITSLNQHTIFLCQGIARGSSFNASDIAAKKFIQQTRPINLRGLASDWADEMITHISRLCRSDPDIIKKMKPDAVVGIFLGHDGSGPVRGVQVKIRERKGKVSKRVASSIFSVLGSV